jgi:hypothetical protein
MLIKSKYKLQFLSSSSFNVKGASVLALSPQHGSIRGAADLVAGTAGKEVVMSKTWSSQ